MFPTLPMIMEVPEDIRREMPKEVLNNDISDPPQRRVWKHMQEKKGGQKFGRGEKIQIGNI